MNDWHGQGVSGEGPMTLCNLCFLKWMPVVLRPHGELSKTVIANLMTILDSRTFMLLMLPEFTSPSSPQRGNEASIEKSPASRQTTVCAKEILTWCFLLSKV